LEESQLEDRQIEPSHPEEGERVSLARTFGGRSLLQEILETILLALLLFVLINLFTARFQVQGSCMEPTLQSGQYLIVSKLTYWIHPPERGDIIVLHPPNNSKEDYIKRIVGLPEEQVEVQEGQVWVDGVPINEPYVANPPAYSDSWQLGEEEYLVLGDNRSNARDSHNWGTLPKDNIVGKVWLCYWPPEKWGLAAHHTFTGSAEGEK